MSNSRRSLLISVALALCTLALYAPATRFSFVNFDDTDYILNNEAIHGGVNWPALRWAFTTSYASNWHPLTWVSHMIDCVLYGPRPAGHHLTNILLHAANVVLLFLVLRQLTGATWRSAIVAALFAWHPLHVESVAWISERKDVLSTCFWLLTISAYAQYVSGTFSCALAQGGPGTSANGDGKVSGFAPSARYYFLALLLFTFALLAKPMVVTLPFVLLLLDIWPLGRTSLCKAAGGPAAIVPWTRLALEKLPFLLLALLDCAATVWAQKAGNSVVSTAALPMLDRVSNALAGYVVYLGNVFWPVNLGPLYPYAPIPVSSAIVAASGLAGISLIAWRWRQSSPWFAFGWFWFLGTLMPVIGLLQVGIQSHADRYMYIPSIGIFIAVVWSLSAWCSSSLRRTRWLASAAVLSLVVLAVLTGVQISYWRDSVTLFSRAVAVTHDNILAEYNLGEALAREGVSDQAEVHYRHALAIHPNPVEAQYNSQTEAHFNLGALYAREGRYADAATEFRAILAVQPDHAKARSALETVLQAQTGKTATAPADKSAR